MKIKNQKTTDNIRRYEVSLPVLMHFFKTGKAFLCTDGLPGNAKLVGFYVDKEKMNLTLYVEHPNFYPVEAGEPIPEGPFLTFRDLTEARQLHEIAKQIDKTRENNE